jgi:hypothetical protein
MLAATTPAALAIAHAATTEAATAAATPIQLPARSRSRRGSHTSRWRSVPWVYSLAQPAALTASAMTPMSVLDTPSASARPWLEVSSSMVGRAAPPMPRLLDPAVATATTVPTHSANVPAASAPSIPGRRSLSHSLATMTLIGRSPSGPRTRPRGRVVSYGAGPT